MVTQQSKLTINSSAFHDNEALQGRQGSRGGAIAIFGRSTLVVTAVQFERNAAQGTKAYGGALCVSDAETASFSQSAFLQNRISVYSPGVPSGSGGAVHCDSGNVDVAQCNFTNNLVETEHPMGFVTGGAVSIGEAGKVRLHACELRLNRADAHSISVWPNTRSGSHVSNSGTLLLENCQMSDLPESLATLTQNDEPDSPYWLVAIRGTTYVETCTIQSSTNATVFLLLGDAIAEALVAGSDFTNATIQTQTPTSTDETENLMLKLKLGVLNSTFNPPLPPEMDSRAACSARVSGVPVCDPSAYCSAGPTGGVRCDCEAAGLHYARDVPPDGRLCDRRLFLDVGLNTGELRFEVRKPGKHPYPVTLGVRNLGGQAVNVSATKTTRLQRNDSALDAKIDHSVRPDENFTVSRHGLALNWTRQQHPSESMALPGSMTCLAPTDFEFELLLDCTNTVGQCAFDGDVIKSTIDIRVNEAGSETNSTVVIFVNVRSAASCTHSLTAVVPTYDILYHDDAVLGVYVNARDVDNLSIAVSDLSAIFNITWQGRKMTVQRAASDLGSYYAEVPRSSREAPGKYELRVAFEQGFNEATAEFQPCTLTSRVFEIRCRAGFVDAEGECQPKSRVTEVICATTFGIAALLLLPFAWTRSWEWRRFGPDTAREPSRTPSRRQNVGLFVQAPVVPAESGSVSDV